MIEDKWKHIINAAQGWLELEDFESAANELEGLPPALKEEPPVIELRSEISARQGLWGECESYAKQLVESVPDHPGFWVKYLNSIFHQERFEEAYNESKKAVQSFPKDEAIPYNMACYATALGKLEEADQWMGVCLKLSGRSRALKQKAQQDPDLDAYWAWKKNGGR